VLDPTIDIKAKILQVGFSTGQRKEILLRIVLIVS